MFHVPESNRLTGHHVLSSDSSYENNGFFIVDSIEPGWKLACMASDQDGWEHVSIHAYNKKEKQRIPSWKEMCQIKNLFWDDEDLVIQYHPRKSNYINQHDSVLHLWKPIGKEIPTPPLEMI